MHELVMDKGRLKALVVLKDGYGTVSKSPRQHISFDDGCPVCGVSGLTVKRNTYCADGEFYDTDNVYCPNGCRFRYDDLKGLEGFVRRGAESI